MTESLSYVGFCSSCGTGPLGIRFCGQCHNLVALCEECDALWRTPECHGPAAFPEQPELPCPHCHGSLLSADSHWATNDEIAVQLEWQQHVVGTGELMSAHLSDVDVRIARETDQSKSKPSVSLESATTLFLVVPREGVAPVRIGMSRAEVRSVMRENSNSNRSNVDSFLSSCFHVHYDDHDQVDFIELAAGLADVVVLFDETDVFRTPADDVIAAIAKHAPFNPTGVELGYVYEFPDLDICVWRSSLDRECFQTIGVGRRGYYAG